MKAIVNVLHGFVQDPSSAHGSQELSLPFSPSTAIAFDFPGIENAWDAMGPGFLMPLAFEKARTNTV